MLVKFSLRWKLILSIGLPLLEVYLIMVFLHYRSTRNAAIQNLEMHLSQLVGRHAAQLDGELRQVAEIADGMARGLTSRPDVRENDLYRLLRAQVSPHAHVEGATLGFVPNAFHESRDAFAPSAFRSQQPGIRVGDRAWSDRNYQAADWYLLPTLVNKSMWTSPSDEPTANGGPRICSYSAPFYLDDQLRGVASVHLSVEYLQQLVSDLKIDDGYCMLITDEGTFLAHPNRNLVARESIYTLASAGESSHFADLGQTILQGGSGVKHVDQFMVSSPAWIVYAPVQSTGWTFAAVIPEEHILGPVQTDLHRSLFLLMVGLVTILIVVAVAGTRIARPIVELAGLTRRIAAGDMSARAPLTKQRDEIGDLSRAFNRMVDDLNAQMNALADETTRREAVEGELRVGRQIQSSLLPDTLELNDDQKLFDLHAVNVPAKQVAGDFYDYFFVSDELLAIVIADVSGKGVPAAMIMAVCRTMLRTAAQNDERIMQPGEVLGRINELLVLESTSSMFVTMFLAHYNIRTGEVEFANAGHNLPYLLDSSGSVQPVGPVTGAVLGVFPEEVYEQARVTIEPGQALVMYTDGVTEARAPDGMMYESRKFEELLGRRAGHTPQELCDIAVEVLNRYQGGVLADDITLLVIRRHAEQGVADEQASGSAVSNYSS